MTIHVLTEEVTLNSQVVVVAPPGESPAKVVKLALAEVSSAREKVNMIDMPTHLHVSEPIFDDADNRWHVRITYKIRTSDVVDI